MVPVTVGMLEGALGSIPDTRGQGLGKMGPSLLKEASWEAKQELVDILNKVEREVTLPASQMQNLVCLLLKPDGGKRPVWADGHELCADCQSTKGAHTSVGHKSTWALGRYVQWRSS